MIGIHCDAAKFGEAPYTYDGRAYYKVESTTILMPRSMFEERLRRSNSFFFKHLSQSGIIKGLRREEQLEIPIEALREALTNSLCHRLLDSPSGSVGISIFDDRVEIENTGHLPNELTIETIKQPHRSYPQNPIIANALYMTAFLESWGTGVNRIVKACKTVGLPEPEYGTDGCFVWIVFKRPNAVAKTGGQIGGQIGGQTTVEQVYTLIKNNPNITRKQLVETTGKASSFIQKCINRLKESKRILRVGSDKSGYWKIINDDD